MRAGRVGRWLGVRLALVVVVVGVVVAGLPASAGAFGIVNRCYVAIRNETNVTLNIDFFAGGPWPQVTIPDDVKWAAAHASNPGVDDLRPGQLSRLFSDGGPLVCELNINAALYDRTGASRTRVAAVGCTLGDHILLPNTFSCRPWDYLRPGPGGPLTFRIDHKVDDFGVIGGTLVVRSATGSQAFGSPPALGPKPGPPLLRRGDLPGRGWHAPSRAEVRKLISSLSPTRRVPGCASTNTTLEDASSGTAWLFVRGGLGELAMGTGLSFARPVQARRAREASLTPSMTRCFARGISARKGLSASAQRLGLGRFGDGSSAYRIVIHSSAPRGSAYLDLVSLRKGRGMALILFYAEDHPMAAGIERVAAQAVVRRIKR